MAGQGDWSDILSWTKVSDTRLEHPWNSIYIVWDEAFDLFGRRGHRNVKEYPKF
jgi:hypothetical protein